MFYYRINKNHKEFFFIKENEKLDLSENVPFFKSICLYREHETKLNTVAGLQPELHKALFFDFDGDNLDYVKSEVLEFIKNLKTYGITFENLEIFFSGKKGFTVVIPLNFIISLKELKNYCLFFGGKFNSLDKKFYCYNRVLRIPNTINEKSGLYKIQLKFSELINLKISEILELAKSKRSLNITAVPVTKLPLIKENFEIIQNVQDVKKPDFLPSCKYELQQGHFLEGMRSNAFLCLASTYKNLGFDKEHTFSLLKIIAEKQAKFAKSEVFPFEELERNIVNQVYSSTWNGGSFSCKKDGWLKEYCNSLGEKSCNKNKPNTIYKFADLIDIYKQALNKVNIKITTSLPSLDKDLALSNGQHLGILGAPGSGKSSLALQILKENSKNNVNCLFVSLDMSPSRIYEKVLLSETSLKRNELEAFFLNENYLEYSSKIDDIYKNVYFLYKSSCTVKDIENRILEIKKLYNVDINLVVIDYFEQLSSSTEHLEESYNYKNIMKDLTILTHYYNITLITLFQPNKAALSEGPKTPLLDYTKIKGTSFLYQSTRSIISIWRPNFDPSKEENEDNTLKIAILKNDLGSLKEFSYGWDGKTGRIFELNDEVKSKIGNTFRNKNDFFEF